MGLRSILIKPYAAYHAAKQRKWALNPIPNQENVFQNLLEKGLSTKFGKEHKLQQVRTYEEFIEAVPIRDYEGISPYIEDIKRGEKDVLWPGRPQYFAKTSGTTSGTKYIPITKDSAPNHVNSAVRAVLSYIHETGKSAFLDYAMVYLSGSPVLEREGDILVGRLSGIANHHVPGFLKRYQIPTQATNSIEDWEHKVEMIAQETLPKKLGLIGGIPPWVQMYIDKLTEKTGKKAIDIFPQLQVLVYGGVNFEPYASKLYDAIGKKLDSIELFPASEGFLAYQDSQEAEGMLLLVDAGIFYEFIPLEDVGKPSPKRLKLKDVQIGRQYAIIINSNAGLWGYDLGDIVKFVSTRPYRIIVTGRTKQFISAFGEHVIAEEVEKALKQTMLYHPEVKITEFTVAPNVTPDDGKPRHEWFFEFSSLPANLPAFERRLDEQLRKLNTYYNDLIQGAVLEPLHVIPLPKNSFIEYMKGLGKLGGQNKVPRLANNRDVVNALTVAKR